LKFTFSSDFGAIYC